MPSNVKSITIIDKKHIMTANIWGVDNARPGKTQTKIIVGDYATNDRVDELEGEIQRYIHCPSGVISTASDDLNMNGYHITNLHEPEKKFDGANKNYVDRLLVDLDDDYLRRDGSTHMTSALNMKNQRITLLAEPVDLLDAVSLKYLIQYTDRSISTFKIIGILKVDGNVPMVADLNMGSHRIINLARAIHPHDAVSKIFMEDHVSATVRTISAPNANLRGYIDNFLKRDGTTAPIANIRFGVF